ncbi:MAG: TIGR03936 family radical SAM-associated protein [Faecousia sp.]
MPRALFQKTGNAVWISHLDLMRVFQRAFKRAGLHLTHTQGFNPRPSVSIALPLSVGIESQCELLDFELEGETRSNEEILRLLNENLIDGVKILGIWDECRKIGQIAYLDCVVSLEYDAGIPQDAVDQLREFFSREEVMVEKRTKNGPKMENIIPMIRRLEISCLDDQLLELSARVCCQNPTLNPMQMVAAIEHYLPTVKPDFAKCRRVEIYDTNECVFR